MLDSPDEPDDPHPADLPPALSDHLSALRAQTHLAFILLLLLLITWPAGASAERKQPITATRTPQRPANAPQRSFRSFCPDQTSSPAVCSELRAPDPAPQSLSHTHTQPTDYDLFMFLYHTFVGAQIIQYNIIIITYNPNINNL